MHPTARLDTTLNVMIPYGRQDIDQRDIDAVIDVLKSDFLTQGPSVEQFETAVSARVGVAHAVAVNSATSALHIAVAALGAGPGDVVWTVPNTFVASANCARYCGTDVDFVDIDPTTWNMSVPALAEKLGRTEREGRLPKIVIPVHFAGQPTDQEAIYELSRKYGFRIIEDASHAIGASRNGEPVGSCRWSDVTVFSFHPVKIITSAEGGMALTNDPELARAMGMLRSHGITRDAGRFVDRHRAGIGSGASGAHAAAWYYEQQGLGFNYRLTDLHAALGKSQLDRLEHYVERRNALARRYDSALADLPLELPTVSAGNVSAFHLYVVRLTGPNARAEHRPVFDALRAAGVGVNLHYIPVHLQPYYQNLGFVEGQFPEAERHGATAITLPLYPALDEATQDVVIAAVRSVVRR